jgi:hypothetical protein
MTAISFTNTLQEDETLKRTQRPHARFINTAMTVTLLGAVSSDALDDGRVVSGPGGQHDLVAMAHDLEGARSIIAVRSTRRKSARDSARTLFGSYGNATVPRHLRDIVCDRVRHRRSQGKSDRDSIVPCWPWQTAPTRPTEAAGAGSRARLRSLALIFLPTPRATGSERL